MRDFKNDYVDQKGKLRDLESKNKEYHQPPKPMIQENSFLEDNKKDHKVQSEILSDLKKELANLKEDSKKLERNSSILMTLSILLLVSVVIGFIIERL